MNRFAFFWLVLTTVLVSAETRELYILHTNDIHGYVESYEGGGLEQIATLVEEFRREHPGQVVLLDGGDTSLGTPLSGLFHGLPTAEIMDLMNYDAVVLGNHEFNWGKEKMKALTREMNTTVLCANLVREDGDAPPYPGWTVLERNGVRLAVVGLVAPDTPRRAPLKATEDWLFVEPSAAVEATLPVLDEHDVLICLNHIGVDEDKSLARAIPSIDLIVGGHSHTPLPEAVYENGVPIVQAGCYGQYLGVVRVEVDTESDSLTVLESRLLSAGSAAEPEPAAHGVVEKFAAELRPLLETTLATVTEEISKEAPEDSYDTPLGNYISDVFRRQAGTDVALYNRGGVRFSMEPGPLKAGKVFELFPFDDPVTVLEADGQELLRVIEQGTVDGEGPLSVSGLTAVIGEDQRIDIMVGEKPLDPDTVYRIATTRFLADGGDGMASLAGLPRVETLPFTRDVLLEDLKTHSQVRSPGAGRLLIR